MEKYMMLSKDELRELESSLTEEYAKAQQMGLKLDMSRGKPSPAQLDIAMGILDTVNSSSDIKSEDGVDCRNYGGLDGI
ncbi:MAG: aminotransferase, partial [Lachnospiraceae bacterium]